MSLAGTLHCSRCEAALVPPGDGAFACPACGHASEWTSFPALHRVAAAAPRPVTVEDGATCYHHPGRRAERICDGCGRFLCALCDIPYHGQHLCPVCVDAGASPRELRGKRYPRYDVIALHLALAPLLFPLLVIFTLPAAIGVLLLHGRKPCGYLPRYRPRMTLALLLTALQATFVGIAILNAWVLP